MKINKNYYLMINADSFNNVKKENDLIIPDNKKIEKIFDKYAVPKEYQRIILKIRIGDNLGSNEAIELATNRVFYFKIPFIKTILSSLKKEVILYDNDYIIKTGSQIYSFDYVKSFLKDIIALNLASNYLQAISEIMDREIVLDKEKTITKKKKH